MIPYRRIVRCMTYEEIFQFVDAEPFRPFRIQMASGRTFDVRHPKMIRVGVNEVVVFQFSKQDGRRVYEKFEILGFEKIVSLDLSMPNLG